MEKKLNLGCGFDYKKSTTEEEWINIDCNPKLKADFYCDFNIEKLPFKDNEFDYVFFNHVIEHLSPDLSLWKFFDEISRVMKKDGLLKLNCPHFSGWNAYGLDHKRFFQLVDFNSLPQFECINYGLYNSIENESRNGLKKRKWHSKFINNFFEYIGNINPHFTERFLCYYLGGFTEMRIILKNRKLKMNGLDALQLMWKGKIKDYYEISDK